MWLSEKFGALSVCKEADMNKEKLRHLFDFEAPTDAEPTTLTASDVLRELGVPTTKRNQNVIAKVLAELVGKSARCRVGGKCGRYYALPPRKVDFL